MLFDEPTSQLDALTDTELRQSLEQLRGRRTIVIVAHRLSTVLDADQIVVLENGAARAVGTYGT